MLQLQFVILGWIVLVAVLVAVAFHAIALVSWLIRRARHKDKPQPIIAQGYSWGYSFKPSYSDSVLATAAWFPIGVAVFFAFILAITAIPFNANYWVITDHTGTVSSTTHPDKGIVLNGDSSTNYVVTLGGSPTQYVVNDARALSVKIGQRIDLACTLQWNYGGRDQFNCSLAK